MKIYLKNYVLWLLILGTLQSLTAQTNDHDFPISSNMLKKIVNPITETPKENYKEWLVGTSWEFTAPLFGKRILNFLPNLQYELIVGDVKTIEGKYKLGEYGNALKFDKCNFAGILNDKKAFYFVVPCSKDEKILFTGFCGEIFDCEYKRIK